MSMLTFTERELVRDTFGDITDERTFEVIDRLVAGRVEAAIIAGIVLARDCVAKETSQTSFHYVAMINALAARRIRDGETTLN